MLEEVELVWDGKEWTEEDESIIYGNNGLVDRIKVGNVTIIPIAHYYYKGQCICKTEGSRLIGADEISRNHLDHTIHVRRNGIETVYNEEDIEVKNDTIEIRG